MIIVSVVYFARAGQYAPQKIDAPRTSIGQGLIILSKNQNYWAGFASSFAVYLQSNKPSNNQQVGLILWQVDAIIPLNSYLSFTNDGVLSIWNSGILIWSNEKDLLPEKERPAGPYQLSVSEEGRLQVASKSNGKIIWQRPEPDAFTPIPYSIPSPSQLQNQIRYPSENQTYYAYFNSSQGILSLYKNDEQDPLWSTPNPSLTMYSPPFVCNISLFGNLQITDAFLKVAWSSQTVNLNPRTVFFFVVSNIGSFQIWKRYLGENRVLYWELDSPNIRQGPYYSLSTGESLVAGSNIFIQSQNGVYSVALTTEGKFIMYSNNAAINSTGEIGQLVTMDSTSGQMFQIDTKTGTPVWSNHAPYPQRGFPLNFTLSDSGSLVWADRLGLVIASFVSLNQQ
jgi:outer membrane protein assembly factor BamB